MLCDGCADKDHCKSLCKRAERYASQDRVAPRELYLPTTVIDSIQNDNDWWGSGYTAEIYKNTFWFLSDIEIKALYFKSECAYTYKRIAFLLSAKGNGNRFTQNKIASLFRGIAKKIQSYAALCHD